MLINWFTICAQAINFLILVWLLKHFLYKPILGAIDAREKGIATGVAQAKAKVAEADKERDDLHHKNELFDRQRATLLAKAIEEAKTERQHLLDQAHAAADAVHAKRTQAQQIEQRNLNQEIVRWTQKEVFAIARKTLTDLAAASLEELMTDVFIKRLRGLNGAPKDQLKAALETSPCIAILRSTFDLPSAQQIAIETAITETFAAKPKLQFQTVPELVAGIELSIGGQKVSWSIADYLGTLQKSADKLWHNNVQSEPKPETQEPDPPTPPQSQRPLKHDAKNGPAPATAAAKGDR